MIECKPIVSVVHFEKGCSGELVIIGPVPNEPAASKTQLCIWIGETSTTMCFIGSERLVRI